MATYTTAASAASRLGVDASEITDTMLAQAEADVDLRLHELGYRAHPDTETERLVNPARLKVWDVARLRDATNEQVAYRRSLEGSGIFDEYQHAEVSGPAGNVKGRVPTFSPHGERHLRTSSLVPKWARVGGTLRSRLSDLQVDIWESPGDDPDWTEE